MRLVKILLAVLASIVVLLVVAALVIASRFDPNDYKDVVTNAFTSRTGRTLAIEQPLRLTYFPWLAVETGGVTIGGAANFSAGERSFATVQRVAARVKLMPLLDRHIEVGTIELDGLTLNLARDAELRGNWQDLVDSANAATSASRGAATSADDGGVAVQKLAIEGVRIRDGSIYWRENTDELRYSVTGLDLDTGGIGSGEPVDFDAALQFKNEMTGLVAALQASAAVEIGADSSVSATDVATNIKVDGSAGASPRELSASAARIVFDNTTQTLAVEGLATETAGVHATWQLSGRTVIDNPVLEGSVAVAPASLAAVYEALEWSPPQGVAADDLGNVAVRAQFALQAEPRQVRVSGIEAQLLGMELRGEGTVSGANELAGRIEIPEFTPSTAVQSFLRTAVPPTVDVSAIDKLALATRFDTDLDTGRAALREFQASVLGATISGNLEAVPGARGNTFRGAIKTSRFPADSFAKAFAALLPPNLSPAELGTIEIDTRFVFDSGTDTVNVAPFSAEMFGLKASGELQGRSVSTAASWSGTAKVAQFSPQDLLRRFGLPPQPTSDPEAFTRAALDTRFVIDKDRAELSNVALSLDESKVTGTFTLAGFDRPAYRFALAIDRVNADRYLPPKARDADAGEATAGDIELPENNTMDLDGTMQIGALQLAGLQFQEVSSRVVIGEGNATLENANARLYGGEFNGNFHVEATGNTPGLSLDGRATGLQLEPLIQALTGETANFTGTGSYELNLRGMGRTVIENVRTAGGNVSFTMRDGVVRGFNLGRTLCSTYNATQKVPGPRGEQPKETRYDVIQGTATVMAGTAQTPDFLARTSFMDIAGSGTLGLVEQRLSYDLDAKLTGKIAIPGCETMDGLIGGSIPFDIRGTVTEPTITPDFREIIERRLRDEARRQLQNKLEDKLRDIFR